LSIYYVTREDGSMFVIDAVNQETANQKALYTNGNKSPVASVLVEGYIPLAESGT
jgi:hypothetical protein